MCPALYRHQHLLQLQHRLQPSGEVTRLPKFRLVRLLWFKVFRLPTCRLLVSFPPSRPRALLPSLPPRPRSRTRSTSHNSKLTSLPPPLCPSACSNIGLDSFAYTGLGPATNYFTNPRTNPRANGRTHGLTKDRDTYRSPSSWDYGESV